MFVQNPLETFTKVVQSLTAKGHVDVLDAGKQRSTSCAFDSFSSDTSVAAKDMWKGRQGLQEYVMVFDDDLPVCSLKAAN